MKKCKTCLFWERWLHGIQIAPKTSGVSEAGTCRRYPKEETKGDTDQCGEWESREEMQTRISCKFWADCQHCSLTNEEYCSDWKPNEEKNQKSIVYALGRRIWLCPDCGNLNHETITECDWCESDRPQQWRVLHRNSKQKIYY